MGAEVEIDGRGRARRRAGRDRFAPAPRALQGDRGRRRRGAAGDRRAAAGRARGLLRRGDDDDRRRGRAAPQGVRPDRDRRGGAARRSAAGSRRPRTGWRSRGPAACAAARSTRTATTGSRCSARSPASPRATASRSPAWRRRRSATRRFAGGPGQSLPLDVTAARRGPADRLRPRHDRRRRDDLAPPAAARRALAAGDRRPARLRRQPAAAARRLRGRGAALRRAARRRRPPRRPLLRRRDRPLRGGAPARGGALADRLRAGRAEARGHARGRGDDRPGRAPLRGPRLDPPGRLPALLPQRHRLQPRDPPRSCPRSCCAAPSWRWRSARPGRRTSRSTDLAAAGFPVLAISGGHSPVFEAVCDTIAERLGGERATIEGRGHNIPETGAPYNERLERFLDGLRADQLRAATAPVTVITIDRPRADERDRRPAPTASWSTPGTASATTTTRSVGGPHRRRRSRLLRRRRPQGRAATASRSARSSPRRSRPTSAASGRHARPVALDRPLQADDRRRQRRRLRRRARVGLLVPTWRSPTSTPRFGVTCRRWNIGLADGGTQRLPRIVGLRRAMELIITGRVIDAAEALAHRPRQRGRAERHLPGAGARARRDDRRAAPAGDPHRHRGRRARASGRPLDEGLRIEAECFNRLLAEPEILEGLRRFNERDHPDRKRARRPPRPGCGATSLTHHGDRDRRPRRGRQVLCRARRRRRARLHLPRLRGDVPLRGAGRHRARRRPRRPRGDGRAGRRAADRPRGRAGRARRPRRQRGDPRAGGQRGLLAGLGPPAGEGGDGREPAPDDRRRRLRRRGPRHRHRGQPRRAAQGLPHRLGGGARAPPRRPDRRGRGRGARGAASSATAATRPASTAPCGAAEDAVEIDTTGLSQEEVVARVVALARERGLA